MPIGPTPQPPMSQEEKREEERIRNNLKMRALRDRKEAKEIFEGKRDSERHLSSQRKMRLMCYLESEMDPLLCITIWHL